MGILNGHLQRASSTGILNGHPLKAALCLIDSFRVLRSVSISCNASILALVFIVNLGFYSQILNAFIALLIFVLGFSSLLVISMIFSIDSFVFKASIQAFATSLLGIEPSS